MGYSISINKRTKKELPKLKSAHLAKKFTELVSILEKNPFQNPPPYKKLVGVDYYSRRLNIQHRLVYSVDKNKKIVYVESVWPHYERL